MRFAYADPPYPGCAHLYPEKREVDHAELIARLVAEYPDGWALSTSSVALKQVLALCPDGVRVGAWVKPFCAFKPNVNPAYAWEPVIFTGGRRRTRRQETTRDYVSAGITLRRGLVGAKPEAFCFWLFDLLNIEDGDELHDLFPGTRAVSKALALWLRQRPLPLVASPASRTASSSAPGGPTDG
ncbi:MAG TPA: hypothetical protein VEA38_03625 [Terriglobales bacterium]|nr:hypothetical protein [Terriglobales bacterium]